MKPESLRNERCGICKAEHDPNVHCLVPVVERLREALRQGIATVRLYQPKANNDLRPATVEMEPFESFPGGPCNSMSGNAAARFIQLAEGVLGENPR